MKTFAEFETLLARNLPGYESRAPQQALAQAVERSLENGTHLLGEAGTGTGKSLGYLIPAVLSGKRVIVTTGTKALQDQIAGKDLPFLAAQAASEGLTLSYAILKGRANYLCPDKAETADIPADVLAGIKAESAAEGFGGERSDFSFEIDPRDWSKVAAESEECNDLGCKKSGRCFAQRAREYASQAQVVVVNHALFFTDLSLRQMIGPEGSMLGLYDAVVFDEAHEAEDWATKSLGRKISEGTIKSLVAEVRNLAGQADVKINLDAPLQAMTRLWRALEPGRITSGTLTEKEEEFIGLSRALYTFASEVKNMSLDGFGQAGYQKAFARRRRLIRRADNLATNYTAVITADFMDLVRWVEKDNVGLSIQTAPISVSGFLRENLFEVTTPCILVSATLSVGGSFEYIASRLGIDYFDSLDVGSPFDYPTQAGLYVPEGMPAPAGATRQQWETMAPSAMLNLVRASDGRALLLFTSVMAMKRAYEAIAEFIPHRTLMQGQGMTNKELAQVFESDIHSVLFATRSFMTGIDMQGETLSLVIIDKLPFPVPTEAVTQARTEQLEKQGKNAFSAYTVPVMSLILKQAFGRLIRHRNDRGLVVILDSRLLSKGYGRSILRSLPDAKPIRQFSQVEEFFEELHAPVGV